MKKTLKTLILLIAGISVSACSFAPIKKIDLYHQEVIENAYLSFHPPKLSGWYLLRDKEWSTQYNGNRNGGKGKQWQTMGNKNYPTFMLTVSTNAKSSPKFYFDKSTDFYFDKKTDYGWTNGNDPFKSDKIIKKYKAMGITYNKHWITYIQGIKCSGEVTLKGVGGRFSPLGVKRYNLVCGYYDKSKGMYGGKRFIDFEYALTFTDEETIAQKRYKQQVLKNAVNQIVESLVIKNIDRQRMATEGLIHDYKSYDMSRW